MKFSSDSNSACLFLSILAAMSIPLIDTSFEVLAKCDNCQIPSAILYNCKTVPPRPSGGVPSDTAFTHSVIEWSVLFFVNTDIFDVNLDETTGTSTDNISNDAGITVDTSYTPSGTTINGRYQQRDNIRMIDSVFYINGYHQTVEMTSPLSGRQNSVLFFYNLYTAILCPSLFCTIVGDRFFLAPTNGIHS